MAHRSILRLAAGRHRAGRPARSAGRPRRRSQDGVRARHPVAGRGAPARRSRRRGGRGRRGADRAEHEPHGVVSVQGLWVHGVAAVPSERSEPRPARGWAAGEQGRHARDAAVAGRGHARRRPATRDAITGAAGSCRPSSASSRVGGSAARARRAGSPRGAWLRSSPTSAAAPLGVVANTVPPARRGRPARRRRNASIAGQLALGDALRVHAAPPGAAAAGDAPGEHRVGDLEVGGHQPHEGPRAPPGSSARDPRAGGPAGAA